MPPFGLGKSQINICLFSWVYRLTDSISVIWRRPAITGGGRPQVPLRTLFHHEGAPGRTTDLPQASWIASSHM